MSASAFRLSAPSQSTAGAFALRAPSRAAANRAGSVVYDLRGSIVGGDVVRFVDDRVAPSAKKLVDTGYARNRMAEAR